jgi:hypothetical protein
MNSVTKILSGGAERTRTFSQAVMSHDLPADTADSEEKHEPVSDIATRYVLEAGGIARRSRAASSTRTGATRTPRWLASSHRTPRIFWPAAGRLGCARKAEGFEVRVRR